MLTLFLLPTVALCLILGLSVASIFDFRARPLPGSMGTCAFGKLPEPQDPETAALGELQTAA